MLYSPLEVGTMYVYKIVNKINGKIYVGQTTEKLNQRFSRHMGYQKDDKDTKFYRAVRKYGKSNFYIELIEEVKTLEELNTREEYWIRKLDTVENGYNSYYGGYSSGGDTLSNHPRLKEIKKVLSEKTRGSNNPNASKIVCVDELTQEVITYNSMIECQYSMDIPRHDIISRRCRGKIKSLYRNRFQFYYLEEYNKQSQEAIESVDNEKDIIE